MFQCKKCGACCRHLSLSPIYAELDRGDGICKYLSGNECSIYEERPLLCNVDKAYDIYFRPYISRAKYYEITKRACDKLIKLEQED